MKKINPSSISLTLIFAFLFTGLGQVYLGKRKKGAVFLLIHVSAITGLLMYLFHPTLRVHSYILFYALMFMVFELYVIVDAYLTCIRRKALKSYLSLKEIPSIMFIPVIMFLFNGNILIARITKLNIVPVPPEPTVSMQPVIKKGDVFLVDKTKYRKSSPKLGDV
ncbi:MAG: S26 family signal peptidase, partial [Candidatus Omnitrophica bacterium]|nr:S26 family signal peptidase [Candidatus Omnitrophota bacterium]